MAACVHVIATIRAWNKDKDKTAQDRERGVYRLVKGAENRREVSRPSFNHNDHTKTGQLVSWSWSITSSVCKSNYVCISCMHACGNR